MCWDTSPGILLWENYWKYIPSLMKLPAYNSRKNMNGPMMMGYTARVIAPCIRKYMRSYLIGSLRSWKYSKPMRFMPVLMADFISVMTIAVVAVGWIPLFCLRMKSSGSILISKTPEPNFGCGAIA